MSLLILFGVGSLSLVFWIYVIEPRLNSRDIFINPKSIKNFIKRKNYENIKLEKPA